MNNHTLSSQFTLRMLSDTSFEVFEDERNPFSAAVDDAIRRYFTTKVDTREKLIREGLIKLGWTPPGEQPKPMEPVAFIRWGDFEPSLVWNPKFDIWSESLLDKVGNRQDFALYARELKNGK